MKINTIINPDRDSVTRFWTLIIFTILTHLGLILICIQFRFCRDIPIYKKPPQCQAQPCHRSHTVTNASIFYISDTVST